ncbi:Ig alpha chain C region [Lemmus lemmus]
MLYVPEPKRSPTIYPLSLPRSVSKDPVIVGCLIQDYFPSGSMEVTWSKSEDNKTTIRNFPPVLVSGGRYTMSSQLTLPANQCPDDQSVTCSVKHDSDPAKDVEVPCTIVMDPDPCPEDCCQLRLTLRRPALEDLLMGSDASLTCTVSGLKKDEKPVFTWQPSTGKDAVTKEPVLDPYGCYSVSSVLPGCVERWNNGETFTCTVKLSREPGVLTATIAKVTENVFPPQVHLLPPPSEELALNELVSLTCLMRGFNPEDVLVRWVHGNQELSRENYVVWEPKKEPGEGPTTYSVTSVLRVPAEAWKQGDNYSCMVGHEALPMGFTQKTIDRHAGKPTQVNVTVITSEADGVCY